MKAWYLKKLNPSYPMAFKCLTTTIGRLNAENQQKYIIFKTTKTNNYGKV